MGKGARKRAERKQEVAEFRITPAQHKAMMREINAQIMKKDLEYYLEDDNFRDLIKCFLICIKDAYKDGGLYIDGIVSP